MRTFSLKWNTLHNEITAREEFFFLPIERSTDQQQKMKEKRTGKECRFQRKCTCIENGPL